MKIVVAATLLVVGFGLCAESTKNIYGDWERDASVKGCTRAFVKKLGSEVVDKGLQFDNTGASCGVKQKVAIGPGQEMCDDTGKKFFVIKYTDGTQTKAFLSFCTDYSMRNLPRIKSPVGD